MCTCAVSNTSGNRILNAKAARSQPIGGMIWEVSAALHEEAIVDTRSGAFVNRDLAEHPGARARRPPRDRRRPARQHLSIPVV